MHTVICKMTLTKKCFAMSKPSIPYQKMHNRDFRQAMKREQVAMMKE